MFNPKTKKLKSIYDFNQASVNQLVDKFVGQTNVYIDYANVRPWTTKLKWNIEFKRLNQFLRSFNNIQNIKLYDGTLLGDEKSRDLSNKKKKVFKDGFVTKPVKIMKHSIDYTSVKSSSTDLLDQFVRKCLLRKYDIETVENLNYKFKEMNDKGDYFIEDRKCNFDVEIGVDMLIDYEKNNIDTFVLWSGDSDFYDPVKKLLSNGKRVILFATARRVSVELNSLQSDGLFIFDIQKIRNYICWKKQIQVEVLKKIT